MSKLRRPFDPTAAISMPAGAVDRPLTKRYAAELGGKKEPSHFPSNAAPKLHQGPRKHAGSTIHGEQSPDWWLAVVGGRVAKLIKANGRGTTTQLPNEYEGKFQ